MNDNNAEDDKMNTAKNQAPSLNEYIPVHAVSTFAVANAVIDDVFPTNGCSNQENILRCGAVILCIGLYLHGVKWESCADRPTCCGQFCSGAFAFVIHAATCLCWMSMTSSQLNQCLVSPESIGFFRGATQILALLLSYLQYSFRTYWSRSLRLGWSGRNCYGRTDIEHRSCCCGFILGDPVKAEEQIPLNHRTESRYVKDGVDTEAGRTGNSSVVRSLTDPASSHLISQQDHRVQRISSNPAGTVYRHRSTDQFSSPPEPCNNIFSVPRAQNHQAIIDAEARILSTNRTETCYVGDAGSVEIGRAKQSNNVAHSLMTSESSRSTPLKIRGLQRTSWNPPEALGRPASTGHFSSSPEPSVNNFSVPGANSYQGTRNIAHCSASTRSLLNHQRFSYRSKKTADPLRVADITSPNTGSPGSLLTPQDIRSGRAFSYSPPESVVESAPVRQYSRSAENAFTRTSNWPDYPHILSYGAFSSLPAPERHPPPSHPSIVPSLDTSLDPSLDPSPDPLLASASDPNFNPVTGILDAHLVENFRLDDVREYCLNGSYADDLP
jgi:hypothetical protein